LNFLTFTNNQFKSIR